MAISYNSTNSSRPMLTLGRTGYGFDNLPAVVQDEWLHWAKHSRHTFPDTLKQGEWMVRHDAPRDTYTFTYTCGTPPTGQDDHRKCTTCNSYWTWAKVYDAHLIANYQRERNEARGSSESTPRTLVRTRLPIPPLERP